MTANKPMTGEQLDELMTVAVNMQRDSEQANDRSGAMFAYAVQVAVLELRKVRDDASALASLEAEPVAFRSKLKHPGAIGSERWDYADHRQPDAFELENCIIERLYTAPPAQVSAEPVAWLWSNRKHPSEVTLVRPEDDDRAEAAQWSGWSYQALYLAPPEPVAQDTADREMLKRLAIILSGSDAPGEIRSLTVTARSFVERCKTLAKERDDIRAALLSGKTSARDYVRREHAEWSQSTFGDVGHIGPLKHLSKEALEAAAEPGDLSEWADMQFLLWDAQRRAGITDEQITLAMIEKLEVNKARTWPEPKDGEPRLHIKAEPQQEVNP